MRFFAVALACFGAAASLAQTPEVPHKMQFAGIALTVRDDARREIQTDVDALTRYGRYYSMKVERARTYFPLIEKIFEEEGLPLDFKYLVLQESALVSDAVSVSNAVGFWQFKDFTALEMGLRVDQEIDERMNLISSSRGAAKYLKKNNYQFNNWLLALQAYQMGAGGVQRALGDSQNGAKHMEITSETYWYVKKFLAHKVAFENAVLGEPQLKMVAYQPRNKKTLREIAEEMKAEEADLKEYNKWLKTDEIPDDRTYTVLVPVGNHIQDFDKLILSSDKVARAKPLAPKMAMIPASVNSIPVIAAVAGESVAALAARSKTDISAFLKYNDIQVDHAVAAGDLYLLGKKKSKGEREFYKIRPGDDLWSVSQQFGVRMKSLKKYNHIESDQRLAPGTVIWLQHEKPQDVVELATTDDVATLDDETFDWYTKSPKESTAPTLPKPLAVTNFSESAPATVPASYIREVPVVRQALDSSTAKPTEHIVRQGDTYYSIARQYGVEVSDLLAWNNLSIQSALRPSQVLKVVENEPIKVEAAKVEASRGELRMHEVKPTDTLYSIARQYGVTIKDIMDWNHKKDFSLSRGEKLEIHVR